MNSVASHEWLAWVSLFLDDSFPHTAGELDSPAAPALGQPVPMQSYVLTSHRQRKSHNCPFFHLAMSFWSQRDRWDKIWQLLTGRVLWGSILRLILCNMVLMNWMMKQRRYSLCSQQMIVAGPLFRRIFVAWENADTARSQTWPGTVIHVRWSSPVHRYSLLMTSWNPASEKSPWESRWTTNWQSASSIPLYWRRLVAPWAVPAWL